MNYKKKNQIKRWFNGLSFLWSRKQWWLEKSQLEETSDEDPKVRKMVKVNISDVQNGCIIKVTRDNRKLDKWQIVNNGE